MITAIDYVKSARKELQAARSRLIDEISNYPTPIAGCDEQFNHLLSERNKVVAALRALEVETFVATPRRLVA